MDFHSLVDRSIADTLSSLWPPFAPELILCATILVLLLVRLLPYGSRIDPGLLTMVGAASALYFGNPWKFLEAPESLVPRELFGGMIVYDTFTVYIRAVLMLFTVLFVIFTKLSGLPDRDGGTDYYSLILGALLGMCLMASANHLLMVFLSVEMASVPCYVLAGIMRGTRPASEAALKYSIFGAGAAGVMLYGISLLAGMVDSVHIPTIAARLSESIPTMVASQKMVLILAALMVMAGLAFKLSAVPFHFWCPDVFEGATAEIGAFLSIASKAAALALLVRVALGVGLLEPGRETAMANARTQPVGLFAVQDQIPSPEARSEDAPVAQDALAPVRRFSGLLVGVLAAITCTFGNLAAYGQTNIKRLMAYSTIAHAGYMLLPVSAALAVATVAPETGRNAIASIALYIAIYMFMNLVAFAIIAFLRNSLGTEELADYAGLIRRAPIVVICFALVLFSLVGLPPLAGFVGKFALFAALADAYRLTGEWHLIALLVIGGVNTAISLFFYLRVVKVMTMEPESDVISAHAAGVVDSLPAAFVVLLTAPVALLIVNWQWLSDWSTAAATQLFP